MKKIALSLILLTMIVFCHSQDANKDGLLTYSILKDEVSDTQIKTQVKLKVLITDPNISDQRIRELLSYLYNITIKRTGFKYSSHPTNVFIYLFTSKDKAESGTQWIGMIAKSYSASSPTISINDTQMKALTLKPVTRFGLPEKTRVAIFNESIKGIQRANKEADAKYPMMNPETVLDEAAKRDALYNKLRTKYLNEIATKYAISISTIESIQDEGFEKGWAVPKY